MYDIVIRQKLNNHKFAIHNHRLVNILIEIEKVTEQFTRWTPLIRKIIGEYEQQSAETNLDLLYLILSIQRIYFSLGVGDKSDLDYIVADFEFSEAVFVGDGLLPSQIASIVDNGKDQEFQRFMEQFLDKYLVELSKQRNICNVPRNFL